MEAGGDKNVDEDDGTEVEGVDENFTDANFEGWMSCEKAWRGSSNCSPAVGDCVGHSTAALTRRVFAAGDFLLRVG